MSKGLETLYQQAAQLPVLTRTEEGILAKQIQAGDKTARNKLVKHNIRLVFKAATFYADRNTHVPRDDIIQAGIEGLIRAAEKFTPQQHKTKFSTYAYLWIRQKIVRYIEDNHSRAMRVPAHIVSDYTNSRMTEEEREQYRRTHLNTYSIHQPSTNTHTNNEAAFPQPECPNPTPEQHILPNEHETLVYRTLARTKLTPLETIVILYTYGLAGAIELNNAQLARKLGVSRQRISQLKTSALNKLRDTHDRTE